MLAEVLADRPVEEFEEHLQDTLQSSRHEHQPPGGEKSSYEQEHSDAQAGEEDIRADRQWSEM